MYVATKQRQMVALFQLEEMEGGIFDQVLDPYTKQINGRLVDGNQIQDQNKYRINLRR
jgi:hypothetical protein